MPEKLNTRGQVVSILYKLLGVPKANNRLISYFFAQYGDMYFQKFSDEEIVEIGKDSDIKNRAIALYNEDSHKKKTFIRESAYSALRDAVRAVRTQKNIISQQKIVPIKVFNLPTGARPGSSFA